MLSTHRRRVLRVGSAALLVALAPAAATLAGSSAAAQDPGVRTLTFEELDKGSTFTHIHNTKGASRRSNLQGDVLAFSNRVADSSGKRVGRAHFGCITTVGARNFLKSTATCTGVLALADGTLTGQFIIIPGTPTSTGAVTGGTGAYAGARGIIVSKDGPTGAHDTITLTG